MSSKLNNLLHQQKQYALNINRRAEIVANYWRTIILVLEDEIKDKLMRVLATVSNVDPELIRVHVNDFLNEVSYSLAEVIVTPLHPSTDEVWQINDVRSIRRAVAMATILGSRYAVRVLRPYLTSEQRRVGEGNLQLRSQALIADRLRVYAEAFDAAVKDWTYSNVLLPLGNGQNLSTVVSDVNSKMSQRPYPYRIGNQSAEERMASIGRNETGLAYKAGIGGLVLLATRTGETRFVARSVAIHDDKTGEDSLEAEVLTSDWVEYPEPYFSVTDFRRRPNDRCFDFIITETEAEEIDIVHSEQEE